MKLHAADVSHRRLSRLCAGHSTKAVQPWSAPLQSNSSPLSSNYAVRYFGCSSKQAVHIRAVHKLAEQSFSTLHNTCRGRAQKQRVRAQIEPPSPGLEAGSPEPMLVFFSSIDTFKLWLWFELQSVPSGEQRELLEAVVTSWFTVGRLGGFNAQNMQVHYRGSQGSSNFPYDSEQCDSSMEAMFHDMGDLEFRGSMGRCWVNMGTADEFALDVLINALNTFSLENMGIKKLTIGGNNNVWPIPKDDKNTQDPLLQGMDMRDY